MSIKQRIAVSGSTGFLGGWVARRLLKQGVEVIAMGRSKNALDKLKKMGAITFQGDLTNIDQMSQSLKGAFAVIHCAALSSPWGRKKDFYTANVVGTQNILSAAVNEGIERFIHISSPSIYVTTENRLNINENSPLPDKAINLYAWSKRLAEVAVDQAGDSGNLSTVTLRPQAIVGPGDTAIFPRILKIAEKGIMPVIGKGDNFIDLTCVENVVDAIQLALIKCPELTNQKFNITNGEPVLLYQQLQYVLDELGLIVRKIRIPFNVAIKLGCIIEKLYSLNIFKGEPALTSYSACILGLSRTLNIDAAKTMLGYSPRVSLHASLAQFIDYLNGKVCLEDVNGN